MNGRRGLALIADGSGSARRHGIQAIVRAAELTAALQGG